MSEVTLKQIVEGLLMAAGRPLLVEDLHRNICERDNSIEISKIRDVVNEIVDDCEDRGVELKEVASGWRFQVKPDLSSWVNKLYQERPPKYSRALLETLALIAYQQPITRAEIENVRGVTVSTNIMKTLLEHEWVRIIGHKEVPGRPAIFATTKKFLDHFNLKHLDELPQLMEFTEAMVADVRPETENEIALAGDVPLEVDESSFVPEEESDALGDISEEESLENEIVLDEEILPETDVDIPVTEEE
ncbi:MAG: SMC-Scp complex subunit ScpB [Patescibacteria group bacterium]